MVLHVEVNDDLLAAILHALEHFGIFDCDGCSRDLRVLAIVVNTSGMR
jgi:hypothetical protein